MSRAADHTSEAAVAIVDAFVREHKAAAIPALIGACVMWAVDHGGAAVIQGSLKRAVLLANEMNRARKGSVS